MQRFESRLRMYFHEEILLREMTTIELLIDNLKPEDLEKRY